MPTRQELNRLYREHRQGLFSLALSVTRDRHAAEDAVHDAFARLLRDETVTPDDPTAYVFRAVRNAAIDRGRRAGAHSRALGRLSGAGWPQASVYDAAADCPVHAVMGSEASQRVRQAIDNLPEAQRETLVMKLYGQLTFDQIAQALGEPMGTVTTRYRRTLEKLRGQLQDLGVTTA